MSRPTIEDVLIEALAYHEEGAINALAELHAATVDGPLRSADGTLVVHRADPELAAELRDVAESGWEGVDSSDARMLRRAAALIAGDPEEEPDDQRDDVAEPDPR